MFVVRVVKVARRFGFHPSTRPASSPEIHVQHKHVAWMSVVMEEAGNVILMEVVRGKDALTNILAVIKL